jgi:hypothetical protein
MGVPHMERKWSWRRYGALGGHASKAIASPATAAKWWSDGVSSVQVAVVVPLCVCSSEI